MNEPCNNPGRVSASPGNVLGRWGRLSPMAGHRDALADRREPMVADQRREPMVADQRREPAVADQRREATVADLRDAVADHPDAVADLRDAVADLRDAVADHPGMPVADRREPMVADQRREPAVADHRDAVPDHWETPATDLLWLRDRRSAWRSSWSTRLW